MVILSDSQQPITPVCLLINIQSLSMPMMNTAKAWEKNRSMQDTQDISRQEKDAMRQEEDTMIQRREGF